MIKKSDLNKQLGLNQLRKKLSIQPEEPEIDPDFDLELEIDDAIVQAIDGVLIKADEEEIKLLFYYYKPDGIDIEDEIIYCKGIAEFRISKKNFYTIVKNLNGNLNKLIKHQKKIDNYFYQDRLPMYS